MKGALNRSASSVSGTKGKEKGEKDVEGGLLPRSSFEKGGGGAGGNEGRTSLPHHRCQRRRRVVSRRERGGVLRCLTAFRCDVRNNHRRLT